MARLTATLLRAVSRIMASYLSISLHSGNQRRRRRATRRLPRDVYQSGVARAAMQLQVVADETEFRALAHKWDQLYRNSSERNYSQSFDWCWCGRANVAKPSGANLHSM